MEKIINIGIIAHVDHGKTTLVDHLLRQGGAFTAREQVGELVMDSNDLERERGITIFSKNASIHYKGFKINLIDTPGHADFSSEVERVLKMTDTVLLLVDAKEGPMPQTKFVLQKSLKLGLEPIVVINKIDKPDQRAEKVVDLVFDLFAKLGANEKQLDFPIVYAVAKQGIAKHNMKDEGKDLEPLFETILKHTEHYYEDKNDQNLKMQVANLAYDNFVGRIAIGRIFSGNLRLGQNVSIIKRDGTIQKNKITKLFTWEGIRRIESTEGVCGDIVGLAGIPDITIGETVSSEVNPEAMPLLEIDEPTLSMNFVVNNSPFAGRDGKQVTSKQIKERLEKELQTNVGMRLEPIEGWDGYKVSGRGELHLSILLENMRREGYEVQVSQPEVIFKEIDGKKSEPIEFLVADIPEQYAGVVIEKLGKRKGEMKNLQTENGRTQLEYLIPTRSLLGFQAEYIMDTRGEGLMYHNFSHYGEFKGEIKRRQNGVLISGFTGKAVAFSIATLQERSVFFIGPGEEIYEGMIVGENSRDEDMTVNPTKEKKLSNMRASGSDESVKIIPAKILTLEQALEFIADDELVEVTPHFVRLRKKLLTENERKIQRRRST